MCSLKSVDLPVSKTRNFSFLEALDKTADENFHSDYLAALLNSKLMGPFSHEFLRLFMLSAGAIGQVVDQDKAIYVAREKRLDQIDDSLENTEKGARRIDLYIRHLDFILIVENKLYTTESDNQTTDYYSVSVAANPKNKVFGLLLSPDGQQPLEKSFKSLSYRDLAIKMHACGNSIKGEDSKVFFHLYFDSLVRQFLETDREYQIMVEKFWRKAA